MKSIKTIGLLFIASTVQASVKTTHSSCDIFSSKIFCYGGSKGNITEKLAFDIEVYSLDLRKGGSMENLGQSWKIIPFNTKGVTLESRSYPQSVKISDTQLLINGGFGGNPRIKDQTIVFDTSTSEWHAYEQYTEGNFGGRQIYNAASSYVPGLGAAFYGGLEDKISLNWTMDTNFNLSQAVFNDGFSRSIGFVSTTYFNIDSSTKWNVPTQSNVPQIYTSYGTSVYNPEDKRLYYFGGYYKDMVLNKFIYHNFDYALYFDTVTNTWGNQTLTGQSIPSQRRYHTTTMLTNHPNMMMLYGGEKPSGEVLAPDYAFLLNLSSHEWTQINLPIPDDNVNFLRARHSAMMIDSSTLMMVFGIDHTKKATGTPLAINVKDLNAIAYLAVYETKGGIPKGAVAGIVVGVLLIFAIGCYFLYRRYKPILKRKIKSKRSQDHLEVDWDQIEKEYIEIKSPTLEKPSMMNSPAPTYHAPNSPAPAYQVPNSPTTTHTGYASPTISSKLELSPRFDLSPASGNLTVISGSTKISDPILMVNNSSSILQSPTSQHARQVLVPEAERPPQPRVVKPSI